MKTLIGSSILLLLACANLGLAADAPWLWVEGESAARRQVHPNPWFDAVDPQELSGGAQIGNFSELAQPEGWAEYDLTLPAAGSYHFWLRANPCSGLQFRVDGGQPVAVETKALEDEDKKNQRQAGSVRKVQQWFNVAADGTQDARSMTWYHVGSLDLTEGKHVLRFNLGGETPNTKRFAALDCFVLTTGEFKPNFQFKPGEEPKDLVFDPPAETWAFEPKRDAFSSEARFDLRNLNEEVAGQHGFIRLSKDGNDFERGDGQLIRFWGGSTYVQRQAREQKSQAVLEHHARFLAKRGVNVVRLHGSIYPKQAGAKLTDVDENELDEIYRLVAAMKMANAPYRTATEIAGLNFFATIGQHEARLKISACKNGPAKANAATPKNGACRRLRHASMAVMASITRPGQFFFSTCRQPNSSTKVVRTNRIRKLLKTSFSNNGSGCHSAMAGRLFSKAGIR